MSGLIAKVEELIEKHLHTYKSLFGVDLSPVEVKDARYLGKEHQIEVEDIIAKSEIRLSADIIKEITEMLSHIIFNLPERSTLITKPLHYPNTIFVNDVPENHKYLQEPFAHLELATIHDIGHLLSGMFVDKAQIQEQVKNGEFGLATEGFAEVVTLDYAVPFLNLNYLSREALEHKRRLKGILNEFKKNPDEEIIRKYLPFPLFEKSLGYNLFSKINGEYGFEGLKPAMENLPELKAYIPRK